MLSPQLTRRDVATGNDLPAGIHVRWIVSWLFVGSFILSELVRRNRHLTVVDWPILVFYGVIIGWLLWQRRRFRAHVWQLLGNRPSALPAAVGALVGLLFATIYIALGARQLTGMEASSYGSIRDKFPGFIPFPSGPWIAVASGIGISILVIPVAEEILFRGVILRRWQRLMGPVLGMVSAGTLFALLHPSFLATFYFALLASYLYLRTGTLWSAVSAHLVNNSATLWWQLVGLPMLLQRTNATGGPHYGVLCLAFAGFGVLGLVVVILGLRRFKSPGQVLSTDGQS
jgi:membrane protease YdiL (CAAX protease family)